MNLKPNQTPLLALETSGGSVGVALLDASGNPVFTQDRQEGMLHGKALAPLVADALKTAGIRPEDLGALAVSAGPGSWTGLRIGISMAKAMAWALNRPLVAVSSFEAMAHAAATEPGRTSPVTLLLLRDARSEGCFVSVYRIENGSATRISADEVITVQDLPGFVASVTAGERVEVRGDPACLHHIAAIAEQLRWQIRPGCEHIPSLAVAQVACQQLIANRNVLRTAAEIHALGPIYLRASDPEIKRLKALEGAVQQ